MNILEFLKKGSGIHIKKENRGKFTASAKRAGLSVLEHAKSVLNDPNATPLLKKRANFARNAAKWKHKSGGAFVKGVNVLDSNSNMYKYVKKKLIKKHLTGGSFDWEGLAKFGVLTASNIYSNIQLNKAIDKQIEANELKKKVNLLKAWLNAYKRALGLQTDESPIVNQARAWMEAGNVQVDNSLLEELNNQLLLSKTSILDGIDFSLIGGLFANKALNKNGTPSTLISSNSNNSSTFFNGNPKVIYNLPSTLNNPTAVNNLNSMSTTTDYKSFFNIK